MHFHLSKYSPKNSSYIRSLLPLERHDTQYTMDKWDIFHHTLHFPEIQFTEICLIDLWNISWIVKEDNNPAAKGKGVLQ